MPAIFYYLQLRTIPEVFFMDTIQQFEQQSPKSTRTGVTVYTWGSQDGQMKHQYLPEVAQHLNKVFLQSHNPGHASVQLTLSDTPENREMVSALLADTNIPYKAKTYKTPKIDYPMNSYSISEGAFDEASVYTESVIEVYFSYWPAGEDDDESYSVTNYQDDLISERSGVPVHYNIDRLHQLNPELIPEKRNRSTRRIGNLFRQKEEEISLDFDSTVHQNQQTPFINNLTKVFQSYKMLSAQSDFIESVLKKLDGIKCVLTEKKSKENKEENFPKSLRLLVRKLMGNDNNINIIAILSKDKINQKDLKTIMNVISEKQNKHLDLVFWSRLKVMKILYEVLENHPLNAQQKALKEKIIYLRKIFLAAETLFKDDLNCLNTCISKYNLQAKDYDRLTQVETEQDLKALKEAIGELLDHDNPTNLIHQDVMVKIADIIGTNKLVKELIQMGMSMRESAYPNSEEGKQLFISNMNYYIQLIEACQKDMIFEDHLDELKQIEKDIKPFFLSFQETGLIDNNQANQLLTSVSRLLKEYFSSMNDKLQYVCSPETINELSGGNFIAGKQPDHQLGLPIKTFIKDGLDPIAMLKKMAEIVKGQKSFNLVNHNCSNTTMQILAAGASDKGWIFDQGAFGTIFTPHVVYMRAREYLTQVNNPLYERPTPYYVAYKNYLDHYGSRAASIAADSENLSKESWGTIIKSYVDMTFSGAIALGLEMGGALIFSEQKRLDEEAMEGVKKLENYENMTPKEILRAKRLFDHETKEVKTPKRPRDENDDTLEQETGRTITKHHRSK